ncbi:MAG: DUF4367 domain-containing protein [Clostridia bacterium]|nr:DUF4367 domain-containing protein [Clostridia bacterium]
MTFTKSKMHKLNKALEIYSKLAAEKYKQMEIKDVDFSLELEKKMEKLINRNKKPWFRLINTGAKRVAIIIVVIIIALTSTVLSVDALREGVKSFVVEVYEKFSTIIFEKEDSNTTGITVYYEPTYIPKGYILAEEENLDYDYIKIFKNLNGEKIVYIQSCDLENGRNINTENAITEKINGGYYAYIPNGKTRMFIKSDGVYEHYFSCSDSISKEELLMIAESVKEKNSITG